MFENLETVCSENLATKFDVWEVERMRTSVGFTYASYSYLSLQSLEKSIEMVCKYFLEDTDALRSLLDKIWGDMERTRRRKSGSSSNTEEFQLKLRSFKSHLEELDQKFIQLTFRFYECSTTSENRNKTGDKTLEGYCAAELEKFQTNNYFPILLSKVQ
jgi:hypothetical protein